MLQVMPLFIGTTELLLIGGMALLLFGGKKLPEMMRGLGQGVKEFKKGMGDAKTPAEEAADEPLEAEEKPADPVRYEPSTHGDGTQPHDDAEAARRNNA